MWKNLEDLKVWLKECGYPKQVIDKGIHDALLQGPAPEKKEIPIIPLVSTFYSNFSNEYVLNIAKKLIKCSNNLRVNKAFANVTFLHAFKQPPNLLRKLSHSAFITDDREIKIGAFKCSDKRCKICRLYLQEGTTFVMSNGFLWELKCYADCHSLNILYYLVCNFCKKESYIGKTDNGRERTNNHITCCRHGTGNDKFDKHVFSCAKSRQMPLVEPFFTFTIMMVCKDYHKLLDYESNFHARNLDTMNRPN